MKRRLLPFALLVGLASTPAALGSVTVTTNAQRPSLRVDSRGYAEVGWTAGGVRRTLLVPPRGQAYPGGRLPGRDVSRAATGVRIAFQRVLRRTPDGRYWGLQSWRVVHGGAVELRFSRWRGAPTEIELSATPVRRSWLLTGRATFHARGVTGSWRTLEGDPVPHAAVLECFACMGKPGWSWFNSVRTRSGGRFGANVPARARARRYRATIVGPNIGTTLGPDASDVVATPIP
jgi:hypothetical protein